MPSGGARNRSGPQKDPNSLRGASRAGMRVLPAEPFNRAHPAFPLPHPLVREDALWGQIWASPQGWAWIEEPWRWHTIAMWVRRAVAAESEEANASDVNAMIRLADQIGLTPAGLKENGWTIGSQPKQIGTEGNTDQNQKPAESERKSAKHRFAVIDGDGNAA